MDELERQIVAWVDAETEGVDPVTPAEAMGPRAAAGRPRHAVRRIDRGPSAVGILAVAAAILVVIGALALVRDQGPKEIVRSTDPTPGPTTTVPDASVATTAQRTSDVRTAGDGPTTRGGEVAPASGSPRMTTFIACMSDAGYHPYLADPPAGTVDGEVAATLTWPYGEQDRASYASDHDRCNRVASESQRRRSGSTLVWPLRAGASQSPAEAKRDGIVPALAEFPLDARAVPTEWFDAPEGTWAITEMPERPDGSDCTVGDPDGAWGTERICSVEYGEVVLVDEAGRLLRAYPMPGEVPTWIYPTKDAVYAGRVGDGGLPDSTIARIDRRTLEAQVLVFPTEGGLLGVDLPGWSVAPSSADLGRLVVVGDDSAGPLVASTIGMTSVDLEAVEELFA